MSELIIRERQGLSEYLSTWQAMRDFTAQRTEMTPDEVWFVEHPAVFTLGQRGNRAHLLDPGDIPVVHTDRGGQVTYHGPGQLVGYVLYDLRRYGVTIRQLVRFLEQQVIRLLASYGVIGEASVEAPGVYVNGKKIASLGLRVRHGCSYHGFALNVAMDLEPFDRIHPCGYADLKMTQLCDWVPEMTLLDVRHALTFLFYSSSLEGMDA